MNPPPPFQGYAPFLAKLLVPPSPPGDSIFGRSYPHPPLIRGGGGMSGSKYVSSNLVDKNYTQENVQLHIQHGES